MNRTDEELIELAREYAAEHGLAIMARLGFGEDAWVLKSDRHTAVKVFYREKNYCNERDCYERLAEFEVTEIAGFTVPKFVRCDDSRWIVEMGIVTPPRVLDFGKAYLNRPP
ncbi:hypothetical protein [Crateriforma conspicua]|nr:hypothetical protein [Crateriforma conspicua]TWT72286.1 hypothetical protein Pan14r_46040 [Crateriforma conspicua]